MVVTKSGGSRRRKLMKGSSSLKDKTFDQERSTMDPIDVELLNLVFPVILVPYGTFEDETPIAEGFGK